MQREYASHSFIAAAIVDDPHIDLVGDLGALSLRSLRAAPDGIQCELEIVCRGDITPAHEFPPRPDPTQPSVVPGRPTELSDDGQLHIWMSHGSSDVAGHIQTGGGGVDPTRGLGRWSFKLWFPYSAANSTSSSVAFFVSWTPIAHEPATVVIEAAAVADASRRALTWGA